MLEVMRYLRANGYKTYIVTGGGQTFVRAFAEQAYGIPPEQIVGTAVKTKFTPTKDGNTLILDPKLLLNDNYAGKAEDIHLFIGTPADRSLRQHCRRSGNAGVHHGRRRRSPRHAGSAR